MPMIAAEVGVTYPAQGVIVASPATAPVSSPTNFGFRSKIQARSSQTGPAKDAAMSVLRKANAVMASTFSSLPALKPYQPNQSSPVPSATSGMLCGTLSPIFRRPT